MTNSVSDSLNSRLNNAKAIFRVTSGNFLEMYDFMVFGYYATAIAKTFFPGNNPYLSLMLTLMTFGAGFLMRPLGAIILGTYIDQHGRRKGLLITLGLMAAGTLLIAVVPGYSTLGIMAPVLVLIGRLLQGFSAGVELGGVSVYLSEIAPEGKRGFYVSWQSGSQQISVILAALVGLLLNHFLSTDEISDWGWRIPFFLGCIVVPFLFYIRTSLEETETFKQKKHRPGMREIARSVCRNWALVLAGMLIVVTTTVMFYMITAFTPTFGRTVLHMTDKESFIVTFFIGISNLFWLPVMGSLSDRVGRRPLLIIFTLLMILTAWPILKWLVIAPSFSHLMITELWLSFLYASYNGAMVVYLAEVMPADVKASGFSLAYSLATALFGGFTPAVCSYLIHESGDKAMPGAWLTLAACCGFIGALLIGKLAKQHRQKMQ